MTQENSNNIKLSELFKKDFEEVRKKCMDLWCECIEKHIQIKPDIYKSTRYEKMAYNYKPFENIAPIMQKYNAKCKCKCFEHNVEIIKQKGYWDQGYCSKCKNFCLEGGTNTCDFCKETYFNYLNEEVNGNKKLIVQGGTDSKAFIEIPMKKNFGW